jgi:uncharacterized phage protein gp47/JayE
MLTTNDMKQIKIVFISGMNAMGQPVRKSRIYKKVNSANASLDNVYAFGQAVAALSDWTLDQVILTNDQEILNLN